MEPNYERIISFYNEAKIEQYREFANRTYGTCKAGSTDSATGSPHSHEVSQSLHCVAYWKNRAGVRRLLQEGVNVDGRSEDGCTALHVAAMRGARDAMLELVAFGAGVNTRNDLYISPVYLAVAEDSIEVIRILMGIKNVDVNKPDISHFSVMHVAAQCSRVSTIDFLLAHGADLHARDNFRCTPLHVAVRFQRLDVFDILLDRRANVHAVDNHRNTVLHLAAGGGFVREGIERMLAMKVNVNARNADEMTPLHLAAAYGRIGMCRLLLEHNADVFALDSNGVTPLDQCVASGCSKTVAVFLDQGIPVDENGVSGATALLFSVIRQGQTEILSLLFERQAEVNRPLDGRGHCALHVAALTGRVVMAELLLAAGAQVDARMERLWTPLHLTVCNTGKGATRDFVKLLLDNGADPNVVDVLGRSPLHLASECADVETVRMLLTGGAHYDMEPDVDGVGGPASWAKRNQDSSVGALFEMVQLFYLAICNNLVEEVRSSLDREAFLVTSRSRQFMSPLHYSAFKGFGEMITLLLERGADANVETKNALMPIHYAAKFGHLHLLLSLLQAGAKFDVVCLSVGKTPLDFARGSGSTDTATLLNSVRRMFEASAAGGEAVLHALMALQERRPEEFLAFRGVKNSLGQDLCRVALDHGHRNLGKKIEKLFCKVPGKR